MWSEISFSKHCDSINREHGALGCWCRLWVHKTIPTPFVTGHQSKVEKVPSAAARAPGLRKAIPPLAERVSKLKKLPATTTKSHSPSKAKPAPATVDFPSKELGEPQASGISHSYGSSSPAPICA